MSVRTKILSAYKEHLLEEEKAPTSVYRFCKNLKIKESEFFKEFASLDAVEGKLWAGLVDETIAVLRRDEGYAEQTGRQRLLSFYFTFFEIALDHRSFLLMRFPSWKCAKDARRLKAFEHAFKDFAGEVVVAGEEAGEIASGKKSATWFPKLAYLQFLFVIDFYLKDESADYERTDALIEKAVKLLFDSVGESVIDSAFDLLRFLAGRS